MKNMTLTGFIKQYAGLKGFLKGRKFYQGTVEFTPAHRLLEIKLSHKIKYMYFYDKKEDATYIWMHDAGIIDLSEIFHSEYKDEGTVYKLHGQLSRTWWVEKRWDKVFSKMYVEEERRMQKTAAA